MHLKWHRWTELDTGCRHPELIRSWAKNSMVFQKAEGQGNFWMRQWNFQKVRISTALFFFLIDFFLFLYFLEFLFLFFFILWDICSSVFKYHFRFRLNLLLAPYFQFGSCCFSFEEIWSTGVMLLFKKFKKLMKKNIWLQVCWIKWDPSVKWDPKVEGDTGIWREVTWSDVIC